MKTNLDFRFVCIYDIQFLWFLWPSPPVITFFLISEFSYKLIRLLLNSSIVKSDNEEGKVDDKKKYDLKI